uniref:Putative redox protein, regulator of disulfide bond formation n=1 Tax=uncultured marine group II/III euryarchaeote KM3_31_G10 TaxID=1456433 RepID=A0A075H0M5_9EURY|nr:putative redox protein, regulator of disulfide bond formation [uncultured marine group II/III euryarchaeote KM3_31_G10]
MIFNFAAISDHETSSPAFCITFCKVLYRINPTRLHGFKKGVFARKVRGRETVRTLNLLGYHCPVPVHETRKVLAILDPGAELEVLADDPETKHDIPALLVKIGATLVLVEEEAGEIRFVIRR